jgi:uncharacterized protein (TIGR03435 family)
MKSFTKTGRLLAAAAIAAIGASGQIPSAVPPAFEVASIKPAKPFGAQDSFIGIAINPDRVRIGKMPPFKLIQTAYNIKPYQLEGPDWLLDPETPDDFKIFDIDAKLPAAATADQVPLMLQALLRDRFKLTIRRGSREADTYALLVGKDGVKFHKKESAGESQNAFTAQSKVISVTEGQKGQTTVVNGATKETTVPGVRTLVETPNIGGLVEYLRLRTQMPVIDKTGLKEDYDIKMEILLGGLSGLAGAPGAPLDLDAVMEAATSRLFTAVEKLGLKLEKQKNPVETIIVEHVERTPTEN